MSCKEVDEGKCMRCNRSPLTVAAIIEDIIGMVAHEVVATIERGQERVTGCKLYYEGVKYDREAFEIDLRNFLRTKLTPGQNNYAWYFNNNIRLYTTLVGGPEYKPECTE